MSKIIAIAGLTPGSGKTTVSLNLAASLSIYEKKNLVVDFDNNSEVSNRLRAGITENKVFFERLYPFTDFIPSGFEESSFFKKIAGVCSKTEKVFEIFIKSLSKEYEFVIFDIPSKMDFLSTSALAVCEDVIIVNKSNEFNLKAIQRLLLTIFQINKRFEKKINIKGILTWGHSIPLESSFKAWPPDLNSHIIKVFIPYENIMDNNEKFQTPFCFNDILSPASISYLEFCRELIA